MVTKSALWVAAAVVGAGGAFLSAPSPALARVGDVLALVDAGSVATVPAPSAAARGLARSPLTALAAPLARVLADHGFDRIEGLGPAIPPEGAGAARRLVLLGTSGAARTEDEAKDVARDLLARGAAFAAMADRALKLYDTIPNDTFFSEETWLLGTGAGVRVTQAWDITKGSPSVVLGVIDTGVDMGHPDLASKIWTNPGEIPGNGIDDDSDGYIDDVHGWDFGDNDNDPNPTLLQDENGLDEGFHGTAVAGAAAAATDNHEGIAGVGWQTTILPLKFNDSAGQTLASYAGPAMLYAIAQHVQVLNMSFGAPGPDSLTRAFFQDLVNQANAGNVVCVAAAGNEGGSVEAVPAACSGTLSVGSITDTNARSDFSNYGPWVNISAPGELLWTPICRNYTFDPASEFFYEFFFGYDGVHPYMYNSGTSLSTPIVAGAVSLVCARFPTAPPAGVIQHVIQTGDVIATDQPVGPRLNVYQAVLQPLAVGDLPRGPAVATVALAAARPSPFVTQTSLAFSLARAMDVSLAIFDAAGRPVRTLAVGAQSAGPHVAVWDGTDGAGRRAPAGLYFAVLRGEGARSVARIVRID